MGKFKIWSLSDYNQSIADEERMCSESVSCFPDLYFHASFVSEITHLFLFIWTSSAYEMSDLDCGTF